MIQFAAPEWWLAALGLALAAWLWPGLGLRRPLTAGALGLLVLALMGPRLRGRGDALDLVLLVDRSDSVAEEVARRMPEWEALLERSRGPDDRIRRFDFAAEVIPRRDLEGERFEGDGTLTHTALAIRQALAAADPTRATRILLISDGFSTEPLVGLAEPLLEQGIALDYRLVRPADGIDYRVERMRVPPRVQSGEPFLLEFAIVGSEPGSVRYEIRRDGEPIHADLARVSDEPRRMRFAERAAESGAHHYEVRIAPTVAPGVVSGGDAHPGNDRAEAWVEVVGGPRVLLVTPHPDDPLAAVLEGQGFQVDAATPSHDLHPGRLSGARAVILHNVPAHRLPGKMLAALDFFVREQGGGLLMVGGRNSFGSGGYFESPLDELLPVSMELREERRKPAVAMAVVMDRSGSMAASVDGGSLGAVTKMELANEGAARAVELLGRRDRVAVFAVDSQAHEVLPLVEVGRNRATALDSIRRVRSQGGGIYVYTGLAAAWEQLETAQVSQRHVILFADAADAEEPGQYKTLLSRMASQDTTVSVIGLGSDTDPDAAFLRDVAARGGGRAFFTEDPHSLPGLFAQETVSVARSTFIDDPVAVTASAGWREIAARPLAWLPAVDGYNLSYARSGATVAVRSGDESRAPLVAFWQRGTGRVAAVTFPLGGELSLRARTWPQYGDFAQTLVRWIMGSEVPEGVVLQARVDGTHLQVDLYTDTAMSDSASPSSGPPRLVFDSGPGGEARAATWDRAGPGHHRSWTPLPLGRPVRGAVQLGGLSLPFGPVHVGAGVEWAFPPERIAELERLALGSGGGERVNLAQVWTAPGPRQWGDLSAWLLTAFLAAFLLQVLLDRVGFRMPQRRPRPADRSAPKLAAEQRPQRRRPVTEAPPVPKPSTETERRHERFLRAKQR